MGTPTHEDASVRKSCASRMAALAFIVLFGPLSAQAEKGDFSLGVEYQYVRTGKFDSNVGKIDIGNTDSYVMMLSGDYALSDRWTVSASLPYIKKRHQGPTAHNPGLDLTEFPEADQSVLDDGNFHNDWQDLYVSVSYRAREGRLSLHPFVAVGLPTNDYPFYAHAAVGRNIWHVPVGVAFDFTPYFSDFSLGGDVAYVFTEQSLGVNISHWLINLDARYYLTPGFAPRVFLSIKHGTKGLDFPDDFDVAALNDEAWYFHDRTVKHNFANGGVGFDWILSEKYVLSASVLTMLIPDQVNIVDYGLSFGITRFFSAD